MGAAMSGTRGRCGGSGPTPPREATGYVNSFSQRVERPSTPLERVRLTHHAVSRLETHFGPCLALVWSSFRTIGCRAARSAALYGDGFGANFRPWDVDYESLPSLIGRFEGSGMSGSTRSFDCRIVIQLMCSGKPTKIQR